MSCACRRITSLLGEGDEEALNLEDCLGLGAARFVSKHDRVNLCVFLRSVLRGTSCALQISYEQILRKINHHPKLHPNIKLCMSIRMAKPRCIGVAFEKRVQLHMQPNIQVLFQPNRNHKLENIRLVSKAAGNCSGHSKYTLHSSPCLAALSQRFCRQQPSNCRHKLD